MYRQCIKIGLPPPVVKKMEVWEVAVALGVGFEEEAEATATPAAAAQPSSVEGVSRGEMDLLRARVAAAAGQGDVPEPRATSSDDVNAMMGVFQLGG